jgi:hypothetical protein
MSKKPLSKSPKRNTFQLESYLERCRRDGEGPSPETLEHYKRAIEALNSREVPDENNLEYDLRTTEWMLEKVRNSEDYAQDLYAALCNNDWRRAEIMPILKDESWHCSWRYAGGIIANMRQKGDYIDWYCSGIRNDYDIDENGVLTALPEEARPKKPTPEGVITDEVREDLYKLGWIEAEEKNV